MPKRRSPKPVERRFVEVEDVRTGHRYKVREDVVNPRKHRLADELPKQERETAPEPESVLSPYQRGGFIAASSSPSSWSLYTQTPAADAEDINESGDEPVDTEENR